LFMIPALSGTPQRAPPSKRRRCSMAEDWARPVGHWEIYAKDQDRIRAFSREMFNWKIAAGPIAAVDAGIGAPAPDQCTGHILPGEASRVVLDIQVLALKASMAKAESPGGAIISQPVDVPSGPTIARREGALERLDKTPADMTLLLQRVIRGSGNGREV
jgi:predicted enzyme related to lactoylglutathione lyase